MNSIAAKVILILIKPGLEHITHFYGPLYVNCPNPSYIPMTLVAIKFILLLL